MTYPARIRTRSVSLWVGLAAVLLASCGLVLDNEQRLDRAEMAIADGDNRAAIIDARRVLQDEPDNVRARLLVGKASVASGDGATGEKELRRAVDLGVPLSDIVAELGTALIQQGRYRAVIDEIQPDAVTDAETRRTILLLRGEAYIGLGDGASARDAYTDVLRQDPDHIDAQLGYAGTYAAEGNLAQARMTLDDIVAKNPENARVWAASGNIQLRSRAPKNAESSFRRAIDIARSAGDVETQVLALTGLAEALFVQDQTESARTAVHELEALAPTNIYTRQLTARLAYVDADWEAAQQILQDVLQAVPDYRPAQALLGAVHLRSGNLAQAEMYLSAVVAASPRDADARRLLAETRLQRNKLEEVQATLRPLVSGPTPDITALQIAARASMGSGSYDEAVEYLTRSVQADPTNIELRFQLALAHIEAGNFDAADQALEAVREQSSAEDLFRKDVLSVLASIRRGDLESAYASAQKLAVEHTSSSVAQNLVGSIELSRGNFDEARTSFQRAAELANSPVSGLRYLAGVDEAEGDLDSAADRYRKVLEIEPGAAWAMFALARIAARAEDGAESLRWLERARDVDDAAITPRVVLSRLYLASGDYRSAEVAAREAIGINPSFAEPHDILGQALMHGDAFSEAAISFRAAAERDPQNPEYRLNLARALQRLGDSSGAETALNPTGQSSDVRHTPSAVMLAAIKIRRGDLDGAKGIAQGLIARDPDDSLAYALLGEIYLQEGDAAGASGAYDSALARQVSQRFAARAYQIRQQAGLPGKLEPLTAYLEQRPLDQEVRLMLASAYLADDELTQATAELERVIQFDRNNLVALNNLAWAYFQAGDPRAPEIARRAFDLDPDNDSVLDTLGWILVRRGDIDEGLQLLTKADRISNGRPEIRYHLAAGLAAAGREAEARAILEEILSSGQNFSGRNEAEELLLAI